MSKKIGRAFTCRAGCCDIRIIPAAKRGVPAVVYFDGVKGTFKSHAYKLDRPVTVLRERAKNQACWKADNPDPRVRVTPKTPGLDCTALANKFLRLPKVPIWIGE